jgi:oligopeptide/dipeptide ABC transporter ATP-binding protein
MEKKLQVRHLRISFRTTGGRVQAVRDISFDLHKGETMAIVGESGSGKSVTSKAILGILAGNAIVEGGEILYDGQDLLKINEEDFYKLRGDKIAMIFQDPLSSLNPIMRIGKQLTEAMLLKGKARQRSSKENFHGKLNLLEKYMLEAPGANAEKVKQKCDMFRKFEMRHIELEQAYNQALDAAQEALADAENALFLIEKKAFTDAPSQLGKVKEFALRAVNPYVVSERADELKQAAQGLTVNVRAMSRKGDFSSIIGKLTTLRDILQAAVSKEQPDFYAMGYFQTYGSGQTPTGSVAENNAFYVQYLDEHFRKEFLQMAQAGIANADKRYAQLREKARAELEKAADTLRKGGIEALEPIAQALCQSVDASIDPLDVVKDSAACTFSRSLKDFVATYHKGLRTNGGKQKKYERQVRKAERSRKADYKVAAPSIIDLELVKENVLGLIERMAALYAARAEQELTDDKAAKTQRVLDYLKENASGMVMKITKQAAKNKALKLMEEVGISEPRKRYRQYPFEFSGGMRQRIVIAIALAANPDILICDEPTTALDVTIQAQILELINRLKVQRNLSIIFITHDLGVVANMADRIAVMYAGKIVEYGTADEVFYTPAHPYTWALLSSMPDLDTKEKLEAIPGTPPNMIYPPKGDAFAERNRYAMKIDFERQPPEFPITDTHWAATWLLHPDAPHVDPPKVVTDRIAKMKARMEGEANA